MYARMSMSDTIRGAGDQTEEADRKEAGDEARRSQERRKTCRGESRARQAGSCREARSRPAQAGGQPGGGRDSGCAGHPQDAAVRAHRRYGEWRPVGWRAHVRAARRRE